MADETLRSKSFTEYMKEKYENREDKDNMFGVGITDTEFRSFAIQYLLGENWYVVDPLGRTQINEIALMQILEKYSKAYRKEVKTMKITRSEDKSVCEYSKIKICDVFEYGKHLFMKIGPINREQVNAIRIPNGHGYWFSDNDKVKKLDTELVIKDVDANHDTKITEEG